MAGEMEERFRELAEKAWSQGVYRFTHFLDLAALDAYHRVEKNLPPVGRTLFGGAEGCERQMIRFGDAENCGYEAEFPIACLKIAPVSAKYAEELGHRDYLGALMSLGIERELLGDIVIREDCTYLFCEEHIADYIADSLTEVRRTRVRAERTENLPEGELYKTRRVVTQLSSQRLDALIAHVYKMSRSEAQSLFPSGKVFVNGRMCESPGYTPKEGEIISVRGSGRMRYAGVDSVSKKGRENTVVDVYE